MKRVISAPLSGALLALVILSSITPAAPAASLAITPGARVAIIGDSITEQKLYSKYMEAYLIVCSGVRDLKVFQFGWGGETAGGFASRLANDLAPFKPTVATTCYGMNDGSYRPFTNDIGRDYEANMRKVVDGLRKVGVKQIVIGSPGAVDTKYFVKDNFAPLSGADGYNINLGTLRDIDRRLASELGVTFADVHQPMIDVMAKAKAAYGADYDVCGKDGVHPGPNGHLIMAYAFLRGLGCDGNIGEFVIDMKGHARAQGGHKVVGGGAGRLELESTRYPFCLEGKEKSSGGTRSIAAYLPFQQDLNRLTLKVRNIATARARVSWGEASQEFSREQLEAGINLMAEFPSTPFDSAFKKVLDAIAKKQDFETTMIKGLVTNFRLFSADAKSDPKVADAFAKVGEVLARRQTQLDDAVRKAIEPVRHTLTVEPLP